MLRLYDGNKKNKLIICLFAILVFLSSVFVIQISGFDMTVTVRYFMALCFTVLFLTAIQFVKENSAFIFAGLCFLVLTALLLRLVCFDVITSDYYHFLSPWAKYFRDNGGFIALKDSLGDYNVTYLYFLALFSYIPVNDLYLIKLLSVIFDILLAVFASKTALSLYNKKSISAAVFFIALFFPTIWLNSAYWGQCDSIYVFFIAASVYYIIKESPVKALIMAALAFAFKLQTIFFLPVFFILFVLKKVRLKHLAAFPITFIITLIPAAIAGRPVLDILKIYINQTGTYSSYLNLNSPSVFAFISGNANTDALKYAGILISASFVMFIIILVCRKGFYTSELFFLTVFTLVVGVPYFLPSMHDRYFYSADILSIIYGFKKRRFFIPVLVFAASYAGYHAYLMGEFIIDLRIASLFMFAVLCLASYDVWKIEKNDKL